MRNYFFGTYAKFNRKYLKVLFSYFKKSIIPYHKQYPTEPLEFAVLHSYARKHPSFGAFLNVLGHPLTRFCCRMYFLFF